MSLKQRLVASIVAVLVAALLLVGWVGYAQATDALESSLSDQLKSLAREASYQASVEHRRLKAGLQDLARAPEIKELLTGKEPPASEEQRELAEDFIRDHAIVGRFLHSGGTVEIRSVELAPVLSVHQEPVEEDPKTRACSRVPRTRDLTVDVAIPDPEVETSLGSVRFRAPGRILLDEFDSARLIGTEGWSILLDSEAEEPIHIMGCVDGLEMSGHLDEASAVQRRGARRVSGDPAREGSGAKEHQLVEDSPVEGTELILLAGASLEEFLLPIQDVGRSYGVFVVIVVIGASILGMLIVNGQLSSLEEVAVAATWIGEDEEAPWLPPPGRGEVGQLSLALNELSDRVDRRMQNAEQVGSMTAIRELTSHLVRDIKNPLSSVRLSLQGIQRDGKTADIPERWQNTISTSLDQLERVDRVISYILKAGEQRKTAIAPCSVRKAIRDSADLLSGEFDRKNIRFRAYLHEGSDRVMADSGRLKNSILQLLQNSVEVLEPGGLLEMTTRITTWRGGPAVDVRIRDEGPGIEPEVRSRIFDPFFTTKPDSAGIGLAVARRNVQEFGGDLRRVPRPEVERGVEFSMVLPLIDERAIISERGELR